MSQRLPHDSGVHSLQSTDPALQFSPDALALPFTHRKPLSDSDADICDNEHFARRTINSPGDALGVANDGFRRAPPVPSWRASARRLEPGLAGAGSPLPSTLGSHAMNAKALRVLLAKSETFKKNILKDTGRLRQHLGETHEALAVVDAIENFAIAWGDATSKFAGAGAATVHGGGEEGASDGDDNVRAVAATSADALRSDEEGAADGDEDTADDGDDGADGGADDDDDDDDDNDDALLRSGADDDDRGSECPHRGTAAAAASASKGKAGDASRCSGGDEEKEEAKAAAAAASAAAAPTSTQTAATETDDNGDDDDAPPGAGADSGGDDDDSGEAEGDEEEDKNDVEEQTSEDDASTKPTQTTTSAVSASKGTDSDASNRDDDKVSALAPAATAAATAVVSAAASEEAAAAAAQGKEDAEAASALAAVATAAATVAATAPTAVATATATNIDGADVDKDKAGAASASVTAAAAAPLDENGDGTVTGAAAAAASSARNNAPAASATPADADAAAASASVENEKQVRWARRRVASNVSSRKRRHQSARQAAGDNDDDDGDDGNDDDDDAEGRSVPKSKRTRLSSRDTLRSGSDNGNDDAEDADEDDDDDDDDAVTTTTTTTTTLRRRETSRAAAAAAAAAPTSAEAKSPSIRTQSRARQRENWANWAAKQLQVELGAPPRTRARAGQSEESYGKLRRAIDVVVRGQDEVGRDQYELAVKLLVLSLLVRVQKPQNTVRGGGREPLDAAAVDASIDVTKEVVGAAFNALLAGTRVAPKALCAVLAVCAVTDNLRASELGMKTAHAHFVELAENACGMKKKHSTQDIMTELDVNRENATVLIKLGKCFEVLPKFRAACARGLLPFVYTVRLGFKFEDFVQNKDALLELLTFRLRRLGF